MATSQGMTSAQAAAYAREWIANWNRKDVEAVLSHFAGDTRFTSPRAAATVGRASLSGKDALRAYWLAAVARIESIEFTLDRPLWDPERRELAIIYTSTINGQRVRACEVLRFGADGRIVEGEALYGASV